MRKSDRLLTSGKESVMTVFQQTQAMGVLAQALHRRAHITAGAVGREYARARITHAKPHRQQSSWRGLSSALRLGRQFLLTLWSVSVLAFWLVVLVGFMR
jgi:hypothetical protein